VFVSQRSVQQVASAEFPTRWGTFRIFGFRGEFGEGALPKNTLRKEEAVALVMGDLRSAPPLVRIHSQCLTGDVFGSLRCDCRQQLEMALAMIAERGAGVLIYEQQEGRGIGLMAKLQAYELQDAGLDTVEANERLGCQREFCRRWVYPRCDCYPTIPTKLRRSSGVELKWWNGCLAR
jgi:GTP cyclohydrolase II